MSAVSMPTGDARDSENAFSAASATPIKIRFADVDMMQVVHHGAYVHWFEQIRWNVLFDVLGIAFAEFVDSGVAMPVIAMEAKYRRSFRFTDQPVGYARVQLFAEAKVIVHYAVHDAVGGWLGATGSTTHCYVNRDGKLLLRTPPFIQRALQQMQSTLRAGAPAVAGNA